MLGAVLKFFTGFPTGPLGRILDTIDKRTDAGTERERIKTAAVEEFARQQVATVNGPGRWLLLFFIAPLGAWFTAVCVYSILWCSKCAFPQAWSIAALPAPLDQWSGWIVMSLFGYGAALSVFRK